MSLSHHHRPRVTVNGIRRMRTFHYFWCQTCQRTVRVPSINLYGPLCPFCSRELHHELDIPLPRPFLLSDDNVTHSSIDPYPVAPSPSDTWHFSNYGNRRNNHSRWEVEEETSHDGMNLHSWITLQFDIPPFPRNMSNENHNHNVLSNNPILEEEQPVGPPPASDSAIEALPTMTISETHLRIETTLSSPCAVCKEEFKVGSEVTELPCKHLYHCDCILPWLHMHNTCPICRFQIIEDNDHHNDEGDDHNDRNNYPFEEVLADNLERWWSQITGWRPVRVVSNWTQQYIDFIESRLNTATSNGEGGGPWWRSWLIL